MFSIIVPIYNMREYLPECVDSILAQDFKDFELILIDDGSYDGSEKICDDYAKIDKRVTTYHKKNGGLSDARNYGLAVAKNEFILFCDPDDYFDSRLLSSVKQHIIKNDLVAFNFYFKFRNRVVRNKIRNFGHVLSVGILGDYGIYGHAPMKVYKRSIIEKYHLQFDGSTSLEDLIFSTQYARLIKKYKILDSPLYYYRQRKGSVTNTKVSEWQATSLTAYIILYKTSNDEEEKRILTNLFIKALHKYKNIIKNKSDLKEYEKFAQTLDAGKYSPTLKERMLISMYKYTPWVRGIVQDMKDIFLWRYS